MIRIISWIFVILWMLLIFSLSAQVAEQSDKLSTGITKVIVDTVEHIAPKADLDIAKWNNIIRKNTHFFAYLILGILVMNALRRSGVSRKKIVVPALLICVIYASTDEIHQLLVDGRGAQVTDVLIDGAGTGVGIVIYMFVSKILRRRNKWS